MIDAQASLLDRYNIYMTEQERANLENYNLGLNTVATQVNPNLPPKAKVLNEPFGGNSDSLSGEDYTHVIGKLNEFADSTLIFGEALLKKIEEAGLNDQLIR